MKAGESGVAVGAGADFFGWAGLSIWGCSSCQGSSPESEVSSAASPAASPGPADGPTSMESLDSDEGTLFNPCVWALPVAALAAEVGWCSDSAAVAEGPVPNIPLPGAVLVRRAQP